MLLPLPDTSLCILGTWEGGMFVRGPVFVYLFAVELSHLVYRNINRRAI